MRTLAIASLLTLLLAPPVAAQSDIVGWGYSVFDSAYNQQTFVNVAAGPDVSLGLRSDGTLAGWGKNGSGAARPPTPPPGRRFVKADVGWSRGIGLLDDGTLVHWGLTPLPVMPALPPGTFYVDVSAGYDSLTAALRSDGQVVLAQGSPVEFTPPALPAGVTYTQVSPGNHLLGALRSDGQIVVWGHPNPPAFAVPVLPPGLTYTQVSCFGDRFAALRSDGSIVLWNVSAVLTNVPPLPPGVVYTRVDIGNGFVLASRSDAALVLWAESGSSVSEVPVLPSGVHYTAFSAGGNHALALRSDGEWAAFGDNRYLQLNVPALPSGVEYLDVAEGQEGFGLGLRSDGQIEAWGYPGFQTSVPPLPPGRRYVQLDSGNHHGIARRDDGVVVTWGTIPPPQPPPPPAGITYVDIAADGDHSLVLRSNGTVLAAGVGLYGMLSVPALPPGTTYVQVACGWNFNLALRSDGVLVGWGQSSTGQLQIPVLPPGVEFVEFDGGALFSVALLSDGTIVGWGDNTYGQLNVPVLPAGVHYVDVVAGPVNVAALRSDGVVVGWGSGNNSAFDFPDLGAGKAWGLVHGTTVLRRQSPCNVVSYCTSKPSSIPGCVPSLQWTGTPSLTGGHGFEITAGPAPGLQIGLFLYTTAGSLGTPIQNVFGTLCLDPSVGLTRTTSLFDYTSHSGVCDANYSYDFNKHLGKPFGDPSLVHGASVDLQFWYRDPPSPGGANLTDALSFTVCP